MTQLHDTVLRQLKIYNVIEDFVKNTDLCAEYGFNIPMEYDIILGIYHEVNKDLRSNSIRYKDDLIYNKRKK